MGGVFLLLSKISFYGTTLILVILVLVLSLKFNKKTEEKINDEVSNEYIASYFDGEYQTEIPGKDDGYVVDKIVCDNGATATWNNEEWGINIRNATKKTKCSVYFLKYYEFNYTGTEQVFTVPKTGTYKIELWGAQGGSINDFTGGYGGYSNGNIYLTKDSVVYINIGGSGDTGSYLGGYNGGENIRNDSYQYDMNYGRGGGGATHIATKSGILSLLENDKSEILIVSGGGGGANNRGYNYGAGAGGHAGGYIGSSGISINHSNGYGYGYGEGGSQTEGGKAIWNSGSITLDEKWNVSGSFGQGASASTNNDYGSQSGGGSGYYGGGGSSHGGGGGGSGYIGNSLLTNKVMYCYNCEESSEESTKTISTTCVEETPTANCSKKGNGYARITYIG